MGAKVQKVEQIRYERTKDPRRMLTHKLLNEVIIPDWKTIKEFLPARTATYLRYDKGARNAVGWDEGGKETKIDLPLKDGWYVSDGNPFVIPNGRPSNPENPDALYLYRHQNRSFNGPVGRGYDHFYYDYRRYVYAYNYRSIDSGVALIGGPEVRSTFGASEQSLLGKTILDPKTIGANLLNHINSMYTRYGQEIEMLKEQIEELGKQLENEPDAFKRMVYSAERKVLVELLGNLTKVAPEMGASLDRIKKALQEE